MTQAGSSAGASQLPRALAVAWRQTKWLLAGYSQVLFTTRPLVGALVAAATFVNPEHGLAGLLGLVSANLAAWLLDLDVRHRHEGFYAFNGLLAGLALGLYYRVNIPFVVALVAGGFLVAIVAAALRTLFERYLAVPVLSLPFLIVAWLLYGAAARLPGLEVTLEPTLAGAPLGSVFPAWLDTYFRSWGALYFQLSALSGILVAAAALLWSRLAFLLGTLGYIAGHTVYLTLGGNPVDLSGELLGFNFIIAAIAIGGVWAVPTATGFAAALLAGAVTALPAAAAATVLPRVGLPVLALPLIATTQVALLALRGRTAPRWLLQPPLPGANPEETLRDHRTRRERFVPSDRLGLPLPVSGRWKVTQSFDGPHTHKGQWRHGLDFEAIDQDGQRFRNQGSRPDDFYAFGAPVLAPLPGRVVAAISHLQDNAVGEVDAEHPWGNSVVLWHGPGAYSAYSHLSRGSVSVRTDADAGAGGLLGRVGSTGRSPTPHLHVQAQMSPAVGAPTVPWTLLHWVTKEGEDDLYHTHGVPPEGTVLEGLVPSQAMADALGFTLGYRWRYRVSQGGRTHDEVWSTELDFSSRVWLTAAPGNARVRLYRSPFVLLAEMYEGPRDTALYRFYRGLPRVPLSDRSRLVWRDRLEPGPTLGPIRRLVADLGLPFRRLAWIETESRMTTDATGNRRVVTRSALSGALAGKAGETSIHVTIDTTAGLARLREVRGETTVFEANLVSSEPVLEGGEA